MKCPQCERPETTVYAEGNQIDKTFIMRKRICIFYNHRFKTYEVTGGLPAHVPERLAPLRAVTDEDIEMFQ